MLHAPSAALPKSPAGSVVVLAEGLGSRTVVMSVTQSLVIHGSRAFRLAKVSCVDRLSFASCIADVSLS